MANYSIQYYYKRGGSAAGGKDLNGSLSHHHMLSYPHIYALSAIVIAHAIIEPECRDRMDYVLSSYYDVNLPVADLPQFSPRNFVIHIPNNTSDSVRDLLYRMAWTSDNLFIGPSGKYRSDDPSQLNDTQPMSLSESSVPVKLFGLFGTISSAVPHVMGEGGANNAISVTDTQILNIANGFMDTIGKIEKPVKHESLVGDWVAQIIDPRDPARLSQKCYPIFIAASATNPNSNSSRNGSNKPSYAKLKVREKGDNVSNREVFRIYAQSNTRSTTSLVGNIVPLENEHREQGSKQISYFFKKNIQEYNSR